MDPVSRRAVLGGALMGAAAGSLPLTPAGASASAVPDPWWLGAGSFAHVFDPSSAGQPRYLNDHSTLRAADGTWHLFSIVGNSVPGQVPDSSLETTLLHATAPSLHGPWTRRSDALTLDPGYFGEEHLWAPHVVESGGTYHLFYAAGGRSGAAINLATSRDLDTWTRHPAGPLFRGRVARDPMVLRVGDRWVMYYTEVSTTGRHVVAYRTSTDLVHWSAAAAAYTDPTTDATVSITESPFVVERDGWFHLFIGPRNGYAGTDVFRSRDPLRFTLADYAGHLPGHAVEIVRDGGQWWATAAGWFQRGLHVAPLHWSPNPTPWQSPDNPAVALGVDDRLHVFALADGDRSMLHRHQLDPHGAWSKWEKFGGPAGAVPTLGRNDDGRLEVFSLAPGGANLHHRAQRPDGNWGPWTEFGGPAGAAPAVGRNKGGRLEVFALGPGSGNIARRRQSAPGSATWEPWQGDFAGPAGAPPVVGHNADGRLEVFALAPGGAEINHRWQGAPDAAPSNWSAWQRFGTAAGAAPRVARDGSGRLNVVAIAPSGTGGFSRQQRLPSSDWQDWQWMLPWSDAAPALTPDADGRLQALTLTYGGQRLTRHWQRSAGGAWEGGEEFGEAGVILASTPTAIRDSTGRIQVFAVTADGGVRHRAQTAPNGTWGPWSAFGDRTVAPVPAGSAT